MAGKKTGEQAPALEGTKAAPDEWWDQNWPYWEWTSAKDAEFGPAALSDA